MSDNFISECINECILLLTFLMKTTQLTILNLQTFVFPLKYPSFKKSCMSLALSTLNPQEKHNGHIHIYTYFNPTHFFNHSYLTVTTNFSTQPFSTCCLPPLILCTQQKFLTEISMSHATPLTPVSPWGHTIIIGKSSLGAPQGPLAKSFSPASQ